LGKPARYSIHFNRNEEMEGSYFRGNSIHDTNFRCVVLTGTHNLTIQRNVGYNHKGHCISLTDGSEINNIITDNLIIQSKKL